MKIKFLLCFLLMNVCFLANAATPPSASISYNSPVCDGSGIVHVIFTGTTGGTFSASPASLSINPITGAIDPSGSLPGTYLISYTIPPDMFNPAFVTSTTFTIVTPGSPGMDGSVSLCESSNSTIDLYSVITGEESGGTWTRVSGFGGAFNAAAGTFVPDFGTTTSEFMYTISSTADCAGMPSIATIIVNSMVSPNFVPMAPLCPGSTPPVLPTTSPNGITGTWSPSTIITQTAGTYTYLFTPNPGQCANFQSLAVTVVPLAVPTFTFSSAAVCLGNAPVLPAISTNGIAGTWTPSAITATGTYVFTPHPGECATTTSVAIVVNPAPQATILGNVTVCQGTSTTVTITGTPNSMVSFTTDSGPIQTIALNATGTATITIPILNAAASICLVSVTSMSGNCTTALTGCANITVLPNVMLTLMPNVTVCEEYTLPALQIGSYYTAPNGGGTMLHAGDSITNTQLIYVYWSGVCGSDEESFVVTVLPVVHPTISTVGNINYIIVEDNQLVQGLELNTEVQTGNFTYQWMESHNDIIGADGPSYTINNLINGGLHYYSVRITNNYTNCVAESPVFEVSEIPVPAPVASPEQTFGPDQTLAAIAISGTNIQWYDGMGRNINSNPLPLTTPLVDGVTYYASQTINGFESADRIGVTVHINLANDVFAFKDLKFGPNPVSDVLQIQSKDVIKNISIYNLIGQKVMQQKEHGIDVRLSLHELQSGNYFVKLESDTQSQVIKIIKR